MPDSALNGTIEVVRGRLSDERADQLLRFWSDLGALDGDEARRRLPEVVCVLLDPAGEIAGVNSAFSENVGPVAGQRFWVYRSLLRGAAHEADRAMLDAAFGALEAEFDPSADGPVGLCVLLADRSVMRRHPEAEWSDPDMIYAGYLADGRQVRVGYFQSPDLFRTTMSVTELGWDVQGPPWVGLFAEQDVVDRQAVIDFWVREGALDPVSAGQRVDEVVVVSIDENGAPLGVSSAYAARNAKLQMDLWHYRSYVATAHRKSNLGMLQSLVGRDHLQERFVSGQDTRGSGVVYELEHEGLKRRWFESPWLPLNMRLVGENERGDHIRVHYFPGALAPEPPR
jgi:hypothetical protein